MLLEGYHAKVHAPSDTATVFSGGTGYDAEQHAPEGRGHTHFDLATGLGAGFGGGAGAAPPDVRGFLRPPLRSDQRLPRLRRRRPPGVLQQAAVTWLVPPQFAHADGTARFCSRGIVKPKWTRASEMSSAGPSIEAASVRMDSAAPTATAPNCHADRYGSASLVALRKRRSEVGHFAISGHCSMRKVFRASCVVNATSLAAAASLMEAPVPKWLTGSFLKTSCSNHLSGPLPPTRLDRARDSGVAPRLAGRDSTALRSDDGVCPGSNDRELSEPMDGEAAPRPSRCPTACPAGGAR